MIPALVDELAALRPDYIAHSDMRRTRELALPLARRLGLIAHPAPYWRERHFGTWEGQRWNAIYSGTGNAMDGMIDAPDTFRPGGTGETTKELLHRTVEALSCLPTANRIVVITHGGPIAITRMQLEGCSFADLPGLITPPGSIVTLKTTSSVTR